MNPKISNQVQNIKIPLFIILLVISSKLCIAQKLVEDKVDEFTKTSIKRTSWETLISKLKIYAYVRLSKLDDIYILDFKMMPNMTVYSIQEGDELMLKLKDDEIVSLKNMEYTMSCKGCGANGYVGSGVYGSHTKYALSSEIIEKLKATPVVKLRIYTSKGYFESEVKEKAAETFINQLKLVD